MELDWRQFWLEKKTPIKIIDDLYLKPFILAEISFCASFCDNFYKYIQQSTHLSIDISMLYAQRFRYTNIQSYVIIPHFYVLPIVLRNCLFLCLELIQQNQNISLQNVSSFQISHHFQYF